jgi:hypothetical protein
VDDRRFDTIVRALADHRSRRRLVGGLLGGGVALLASSLRLPAAAVGTKHKAQGKACVFDEQCDPWLVCAWNGYGSAGAACCAYVGGGCTDDSGCCGTNSCFAGVCADFATAPGFGDLCKPGGNPCVYASGGFSCDYVGATGDYRCCSDWGGRCGWDGDCCGYNSCINGVCG